MKSALSFRPFLLAAVALAFLAGVVTLPTAAQTRIDLDVKRAVVRIVPERCYGGTNCIPQNNQPGSGVIIHPTGLILTAWHVLSVDDNLQQANSWDDFVIEVIDNNDSVPPTPRYRAKIVATRPEMDLAILRIDRMLDRQPVTEEVLASLAWLPVYSGLSNQLETGVTPLPVLGYPIPPIRTGRTTLFTNQRLTLDSHNVPDAEMWVQWPLDKGYSGGPGLVQYGDELQVAGIVRAAVGNRTELRDLSVAFNDFVWQPGEQRMYADKVVVTQTSVNGSPYLQFEAAVHALGWESAPLQFQISFFEADSHQPWRPTAVDLPQLPGGQVYWIADVRPDRPVYRSPLRVMIPIAETGVGAQDLAFRIKLGRADPFAQLWSDNRWYQAQSSQTIDVPIPPTFTFTPTPTATNDRVAAIEADVRATLTASAPTATRRPPTATATPTPTVTPTFDPAAQIAAAVAATLTALAPTATATPTPTDTPTATSTPNATATFQAAVRVTLTALAPTITPTPTHRPPMSTPTKTPTRRPATSTVIRTATPRPATTTPTRTPTRRPSTSIPTTVSTKIQPTGTSTLSSIGQCQVTGSFAQIWSAHKSKLGCSISEVVTDAVTQESFQNGYMVWVKLTDRIYVLPFGSEWSRYSNGWLPGEDTLPCISARAFGWPVMGFGKLWCDNDRVHRELGDPLDRERPNDFASQQRFQNGFVFEIAGGTTILLFNDGSWAQE